MYTSFELLYLIIYFITISGYFTYSICNLKQLQYDRKIIDENEKYLSILDDYLFYDIVENIDKFYNFNKEIKDIIVYVDNSEISKFNLLLLHDLFPNSNKIALYLEEDDSNILNLCKELNFKYYNKFDEYSKSPIKNTKEFIIEYCKLCDIKYCFMNINNNEIMTMILNGIFNNDYNYNINNIESSTKDEIFIYNILSNPQIFLSFVNLCEYYFNDEDNNINNNNINNYYYIQDNINENWRTNLMLTYEQLRLDNNNISKKINTLFEHSEFKYGSIIKINDNNIPYWLWENIFSQISDKFNLDVEKQVIQTLFFTIKQNKKDDGDLLLDWRYNYNNRVFILYNYSKLQQLLDNCEKVEMDNVKKDNVENEYLKINNFEINNNLELFLDGKIIYKVLDTCDESYLQFNNIKLNLNDTNNKDLFNNFNYKKFDINTIIKNI
jgi:hypothetical protein